MTTGPNLYKGGALAASVGRDLALEWLLLTLEGLPTPVGRRLLFSRAAGLGGGRRGSTWQLQQEPTTAHEAQARTATQDETPLPALPLICPPTYLQPM